MTISTTLRSPKWGAGARARNRSVDVWLGWRVRWGRGGELAVGLGLGLVLDTVLGDPRRGHPVALYGRAVSVLERRCYRDSRLAGAVLVAIAVAAPVTLGRRLPTRWPAVAAVTWTVVGATTLAREATALHDLLEAGDLEAARTRLTHLVGRDPSKLDAGEIARAAVESVAENTSDAVVAPLLWGAVLGLPGLLGYRAINTLDAMIGHRSPRYRNFGWAAARLDDLANLAPARLTAVLVASAGDRPAATWTVVRSDAGAHPSPNAGWCEAAYAGALGLRLGGVNDYGDRVEHRALMGDGRPAEPKDVPRAVRLLRRVTVLAGGVASVVACSRGRVIIE
jgi:adenosylcobinamide-phosphate synthase